MQQTAEIQVPEGYQKVGEWLIPDQWSVRTLDDFIWYLEAGVSVNSVAEHEASTSEKLVLKTSCITHGKFDATEAKPIARFDLKRAKCNPRKGSIIVSRMNTPDLVGEIGYVPMDMQSHFLPDRLWQAVFKPDDAVNSLWLSYALSFTPISKRIKESATGTSGSMKNISKAAFLSTAVPTPLPQEQTAIANALSDVDALIAEQEKLIAKKQAIQTAAMQQLLTGKTRLPQFSHHPDGSAKGYITNARGEVPEGWDSGVLGDLFEERILKKNIGETDTVSFVGMQDVSESGQLVHQTSLLPKDIKSGLTYFERGDVLVAKITPCFENGKGCHTEGLDTEIGYGSTEFHVLRAKKEVSSKLIYYWSTTGQFRLELANEMVGSAGHKRVPFKAIKSYPIVYPASPQEQSAIATILTDMDNEIKALQQRLSKTQQIKQGMMQELLTGKTRLPFDKTVA